MTDKKLTDAGIPAMTTPTDDDLFYVVNAPGGSPASNKITWADLKASIGAGDGWVRVNDSWSYASASTITVPSGAASIYQKGDRIKFTQTTVKYGVIIGVADTLLTILVNTSYVLANAAISAIYYSHQANPLGFPDWFALAAPTYTVSEIDNGSGGQPVTTEYRCRIIGGQVEIHIRGSGTKAGSNSYFSFTLATLPLAPTNISVGTAIGSVYIAATSAYVGVVEYDTALYMVFNASIVDNTVITVWGATFIYEF